MRNCIKKIILSLLFGSLFVFATVATACMDKGESSFSSSSSSSSSSSDSDSSSSSSSSSDLDSSSSSSSSSDLDSSSSSSSSSDSDSSSSSSSDGVQEVEPLNPLDIPDFIVSVPANRDPIVLQLTDTQIIDASQTRPGREGVDYSFWATDKVEERCYDYLTETIESVNPDFIIITGDIVYGEFDDNGTVLQGFVSFMESFEIPWSPVFGNHDNESKKGVDWQCDLFENAQYCLFEQKSLTGNGNYSVGIEQGGTLTRVFYMLDSNGCDGLSSQSLANGHSKKQEGFGDDQIAWYTNEITQIKSVSPNTKFSFAFHIQLAVFMDAYAKYGFDNSTTKSNPINIDYATDKAASDFGYLGRNLKDAWDTSKTVYAGLKALGVDSIFVGHEHCNSASVVYQGIRFQYGQKSSEYDRFNCVDTQGNITSTYSKKGTSLIGGSVIVLSKTDGAIDDAYIYLCENAGGSIDWDRWNPNKVTVVTSSAIDLGTLTWSEYPNAIEYRVYYGESENACNSVLDSKYVDMENLTADISSTATTVQQKVAGTSETKYYQVKALVDGVEEIYDIVSTSAVLIDSYADLKELGNLSNETNGYTINGTYYMAHDIDCTGQEAWTMLNANLAGTINGNGFTVKNFKLKTKTGWTTNSFMSGAVYGAGKFMDICFDNFGADYASGAQAVRDGYFFSTNQGMIENVVIRGKGYMTVGFQIAAKNTGTIKNCIVDVIELTQREKDNVLEDTKRGSVASFTTSNNTGTVTGCYAYSWENPTFWASGNYTFAGLSGGTPATNSQWYTINESSHAGTVVASTRQAFMQELSVQVTAGKLSQKAYDMYCGLFA